MTTLDKIQNLSDNEVLSLFQGFSNYLKRQLQINDEEVISHPPEQLLAIESIKWLQSADLEDLDSRVRSEEVIPVVRSLVEQWASEQAISTVLEDFMESYDIKPMAAGTILAVGTVILMTIVTTSLKIKYKDGKLEVDYDSKNISNNAVEMVKAIMAKIPDSIQSILS